MEQPEFFQRIRSRAHGRWDQLEGDPELAGPWHQLFKQVQSPRHVVSELLQNADDAGATEAAVDVKGNEFVFSHNGEDFAEEHFASLCRFGYSNKRALHTIGFRGVGFKSTFSLGDEVRLLTPTLSVGFHRQRFTEPLWIDGPHPTRTEVRVSIKDEHRERELRKNLQEWLKSPTSLLFFRHIRSLSIEDQEVRWVSHGQGPLLESEWMTLSMEPDTRHLLLRSPAEEFPEEALEEIRQERMISLEEESDFPPCRVEIVLGIEGRLFVILPTGVKADLPFACNAPFVQDPARVKIKDPDISPTNRWLLKRVGELTAKGMLAWLNRTDLTAEERCAAYDLLTDVDQSDVSLEETCASLIEESFEVTIEHKDWVLNESGELEQSGECVAVPSVLLDVWSSQQVGAFFVGEDCKILCDLITPDNREKLIRWGAAQQLGKTKILEVLRSEHLPKPASWRQLLALWAYVSPDISAYHYYSPKAARIVPVQGKDVLYAASEIAKLGDKKLLESEADWEFLSGYLLVLNPNWPRFLAEQRLRAAEQKDGELGRIVKAAYDVLTALKLDDASDVSKVIDRVAADFFKQEKLPLGDCVRLARLSAALNVTTSQGFRFATTDFHLRATDYQVLVDIDGHLADFVDEEWYKTHVLHPDYSVPHTSCTEAEWKAWLFSGRSGLLTFLPLQQTQRHLWYRGDFRKVLQERGFNGEPSFHYKTDNFIIEDWDFDPSHWEQWRSRAEKFPVFWSRLLECIVRQPQSYWSKVLSAKAYHVATTGNRQQVTYSSLLPTWIIKLRGLPCIEDTWGGHHLPAEVLRRTAETEALLGVEPFVRSELDTESTRPLLVALGVRDTPTGPARLLERLGVLAKVDNPPIHEVEKWYHRLDQMLEKASTDDLGRVKAAFASEKLILTDASSWARTKEVFLAEDEAVPNAAVIRSSVRYLSLWHRIGVAERPTADLAIEWLKSLPSGQHLSADEARRVSSLLPRYPDRVWSECGHWLNLEGEWVPAANLSFALTMQSLVPWKHLFPAFKQKTADLQKLSADVCQRSPFANLGLLSSAIDERFQDTLYGLPKPENKQWVIALASGLQRVIVDNQDETRRVRGLATRLRQTEWQPATKLETIPYINGTPAGIARSIEVLWKDSKLYVEDRSAPKMAKAVAAEVGRVFARPDITDAVKLCYDRLPEFVVEYLEENFELAPEDAVAPETATVANPAEMQQAPTNGISDHDAIPGTDDNLVEGVEPEPQGAIGELETEEDTDSEGEVQQPNQTRVRPGKLAKPSLMERFALAKGYSKDGTDRFYHPDGSWIVRVPGNAFPWERHSKSGDLLQYYWPKEHCIKREPLELEAEVWAMCQEFSDDYTLILTEADESPIEISGHLLQQMSERGELTLYPSTYRLVYKNEH